MTLSEVMSEKTDQKIINSVKTGQNELSRRDFGKLLTLGVGTGIAIKLSLDLATCGGTKPGLEAQNNTKTPDGLAIVTPTGTPVSVKTLETGNGVDQNIFREVPYPTSTEGFAFGGGGDPEAFRQGVIELTKLPEGSYAEYIEGLIKWAAWRADKGNLYNSQGKEATKPEIDEYYAANYETRFSLVEGKSWALAAQNRKDKTFYIATNNAMIPYASLMPLVDENKSGWINIDDFSLAKLKMPDWADNQALIPVTSGPSKGHHVIVFTKDSQMVGWFDAAHKRTVQLELFPPLPQEVEELLKELPSGSYSYDANGLHITVVEGQVVDIPQDQIKDRIKNGQASPLQIYNEAGSAILYAYDAENKVWVDAAKVLQPDRSNPDNYMENYIKIQTWDDFKELVRKEKMVLPPFPPNTYFPPLDKIFRNYDGPRSVFGGLDAEFNYDSPFGSLPENMQAPFRFVNFIILEKNESERRSYYDSIIYTEQVYNVDDGSFSLLHFGPLDISNSRIINEVLDDTKEDYGVYSLPVRYLADDVFWRPWFQYSLRYLRENGYLNPSGEMPRVEQLVNEWLSSGHVPPELESIPLFRKTKCFECPK